MLTLRNFINALMCMGFIESGNNGLAWKDAEEYINDMPQNAFWKDQFEAWMKGVRNVYIHDATFVAIEMCERRQLEEDAWHGVV